MIIGDRASKSFLLFDNYQQRETEYKDQHSLLSAYYRMVYIEGRANTFDVLCVTYHDATIRVSDERLDAWVRKQFALEVQVRLRGSDVIKLEEFIGYQKFSVVIDRNPTIQFTEGIDWGYYLVSLIPYNGSYTKRGYGATRTEALAHAFIK